MLKRNVIIASLMILAAISTGSLFGQKRSLNKRVPPPVTSVQSPRDASSGQSTGKRQHKPLVISSGQTTNGTIQKVGGDVHPGQDGMGGTGMVKSTTTANSANQSNQKGKTLKSKGNKPKPTGFMDYTDDAVMMKNNNVKNAGKTNGYIGETEKNLKSNPKQAPSRNEDKLGNFEIQDRKPIKPATTREKRQYKP